MFKLRNFALLLVAAVALSACTIRTHAETVVDEDGSGALSMVIAFDEEMRELLESESDEPIDWTDPSSFDEDAVLDMSELPETAEIEAYEVEDFQGFRVIIPFANPEELNSLATEVFSEGGAESGSMSLVIDDDDTVTFDADGGFFDMADSADLGEDMGDIPSGMLGDLFDIQFSVSLPGEVTEHNADEVLEDGTLVWSPSFDDVSATAPHAVAQLGAATGWLWWVLGAVVLIGLIAFGFYATRRPAKTVAPSEPRTES